ncbi:Proteolipid protein 2 [Blastocladiella emersonii ATCC 22665]|nr:Proteolipid protein 2 [Blastocladiella emersonii ATCC 22665]
MEDTEWNDALRARGILPPKEVEVTEAELEALVDAAALDHARARERELEEASLSDLDELEDDEDDRVLDMYRRRRMQEMAAAASRKLHGDLRQISEPDFVREVSDGSKDGTWVVCHLFKDSIPACKLVNALLTRLAMHYRETKFVKIVGDHCIHGYPDRNMPTLLVYGHGELVKQIVGIASFPGGMGCTQADLERMLTALGAIEKTAREDGGSDDDERPGFRVNRASKKEEDSDSDWD